MKYNQCPNCLKAELKSFYNMHSAPVHSVLLMNTQAEALNYPKRNIELGFCSECGFISNIIFEKNVQEYSSKYEETQGFSGTFNKFHYALAERLVEKYNLNNKTILEIGCGKGDFITMLCEIGDNKGYGFDPAFIPQRNPDKNNRVIFITDFYSEKYADHAADLICCKMTLEHIPDTFNFVKIVRNAIGHNLDTVVFFQIPEVIRVLKDVGFWDIYYEHCSYFSNGSLEYLFRLAGFEILDISTEYDNQYLTIEAKPSSENQIVNINIEDIIASVNFFKNNIDDHLNKWKNFLKEFYKAGKRIVLWGGGSKSVAFLTTLGISNEIKYVVDINPYKQGTYLPGFGQEIIAPSDLKAYNPDLIVVMNPIYIDEINKDLNEMSIDSGLIPIDYLTKYKDNFTPLIDQI